MLGAKSSPVGSSDIIVPRGTATASACSSFVNGFNSLMMHSMTVGDPSKAWVHSGSASYISATDSSSLAGGGWASSWISTSRACWASCLPGRRALGRKVTPSLTLVASDAGSGTTWGGGRGARPCSSLNSPHGCLFIRRGEVHVEPVRRWAEGRAESTPRI